MEEKINTFKANLTGNYEQDMQDLVDLAQKKQKELEDGIETLNAINSVIEELENTKTNEVVEEADDNNGEVEEKIEESLEETSDDFDIQKQDQINSMISELTQNIQDGNLDGALSRAELVIDEVEKLSKSSDDTKLYCSCTSDFEKKLIEYVFAGNKEVIDTPYSNDVLYVVYSDILISKRKTKAAMNALDRAIYWNFLNRDARSKKIDLFYNRNEIVNCLNEIGKLQSISYTAQDLADCYNKYAYVFDVLKDPKSAYALYILSYYYVNNPKVLEEINKLVEENPEFADMTFDEVIQRAKDNEVSVEPNINIVNAYRNIITDCVDEGRIDEAITLVENDYEITRDEELKEIYSHLLELRTQNNEKENEVDTINDNDQEKKVITKKNTKSTTVKKTSEKKATSSKSTSAKKTTAKKTTAKKTTAKKSQKKSEDK